jgi:hypothetical protein
MNERIEFIERLSNIAQQSVQLFPLHSCDLAESHRVRDRQRCPEFTPHSDQILLEVVAVTVRHLNCETLSPVDFSAIAKRSDKHRSRSDCRGHDGRQAPDWCCKCIATYPIGPQPRTATVILPVGILEKCDVFVVIGVQDDCEKGLLKWRCPLFLSPLRGKKRSKRTGHDFSRVLFLANLWGSLRWLAGQTLKGPEPGGSTFTTG